MPRKNFSIKELEPDEIFPDSVNLPGFERERFEGRLEHPVSGKLFGYLGVSLFLAGTFLWLSAFKLQVREGSAFRERAKANHLKAITIPAERGMILDRNGEVIGRDEASFRLVGERESLLRAESSRLKLLETEIRRTIQAPEGFLHTLLSRKDEEGERLVLARSPDWQGLEEIRRAYPEFSLYLEPFFLRRYEGGESISHLAGYLGYPTAEDVKNQETLARDALLGKSGIEERYESALKGEAGSKLTEVNSQGEVLSEGQVRQAKNGRVLHLSIDKALQEKTYETLKEFAETRGFRGGALVIVSTDTGEVLTLASYPGFDPNLFTEAERLEEVSRLLNNESKPLFNRAISGLYPAGSGIKPLIALGALEENVIDPHKEILSTGSLSLANPFRPGEASIFYDWKAHGWVDMRHAIAVSSNVYFYTVGGGFGDTKGLGVSKIQTWLEKFGFGERTGIDLSSEKEGFVPGPEWKARHDREDPAWRVGDTYNLSIGQGNLQVTPLQMALFAAALANGGKVFEPHIVKTIKEGERVVYESNPTIRKRVELKAENLAVVREGMRMAVELGTAQALGGLGIKVAGKTGTAEIGSGKFVNSWFIGFFPYERPRIALALVLESGSASNLIGAPLASRKIIEWLSLHRPELMR